MYSFSYLDPVCCSMSSSNCCFLTCIQVSQEAGQVVWYSHLFQNFPQFIVIHTVKGFGIANKAKIDVFLEFFCFFDDPADVGNLISGSSPFLKPAWTSGCSRFTYCWSLAWRILNITSVWDVCNCVVVWAFFDITFLRGWNENWLSCSKFLSKAKIQTENSTGVCMTLSTLPFSLSLYSLSHKFLPPSLALLNLPQA